MELVKKLFVTKETQRAVLVEGYESKTVWLPKSQIILSEDGKQVVATKQFLVDKNNLSGYELEIDESIGVTATVKASDPKKVIIGVNGKQKTRKLYTRKNLDVSVFLDDSRVYTIPKGVCDKFTRGSGLKYIGDYTRDDSIKEIMDAVVESVGTLVKFNNSSLDSIKGELEREGAEVPEFKFEYDENAKHEKFNEIKTYVDCNVPIYLYGGAGTGKNHVVQEIADELNLDFYFTNSIQQEYKLTGFIDANGDYHETEFYQAFTEGGIFFLDELDASIPEVLVLLNSAIANGYFCFPNGTETAHEDFRVISAGNTAGSGADEIYNGRMALDGATLDRFVFVEFDYDRNVEMKLAKGDLQLVEFVRGLRAKAKENGIQATFSYRCIINIKKLEGKLPLKVIIASCVVKGLDNDSLNTMVSIEDAGNKYFDTLYEMQLGA